MISIGGHGSGGYGMQESDPKLADKLAALKQSRKSPEDAAREFLQHDLGVDPDTLPYTYRAAQDYLGDWMTVDDLDTVRMQGNSLGLHSVVGSGYDSETIHVIEGRHRWDDLVKVQAALTKQHPGFYTFCVSSSYPGVDVVLVDSAPVASPDPLTYPPNSILRVEKRSAVGVSVLIESMYIRIGGLFDETTPTNLDTMQPIPDLSGWVVCEEL